MNYSSGRGGLLIDFAIKNVNAEIFMCLLHPLGQCAYSLNNSIDVFRFCAFWNSNGM